MKQPRFEGGVGRGVIEGHPINQCRRKLNFLLQIIIPTEGLELDEGWGLTETKQSLTDSALKLNGVMILSAKT